MDPSSSPSRIATCSLRLVAPVEYGAFPVCSNPGCPGPCPEDREDSEKSTSPLCCPGCAVSKTEEFPGDSAPGVEGKPLDDGVLDPGNEPACLAVPVLGKEEPPGLPAPPELGPVEGIEEPGRPGPGEPFDLDDETVTPGWLEPELELVPELELEPGLPLGLGMPLRGLFELEGKALDWPLVDGVGEGGELLLCGLLLGDGSAVDGVCGCEVFDLHALSNKLAITKTIE